MQSSWLRKQNRHRFESSFPHIRISFLSTFRLLIKFIGTQALRFNIICCVEFSLRGIPDIRYKTKEVLTGGEGGGYKIFKRTFETLWFSFEEAVCRKKRRGSFRKSTLQLVIHLFLSRLQPANRVPPLSFTLVSLCAGSFAGCTQPRRSKALFLIRDKEKKRKKERKKRKIKREINADFADGGVTTCGESATCISSFQVCQSYLSGIC